MQVEDNKVIQVGWDAVGTLVERPNRFLAIVDIETADGKVLKGEKVHVHDPGRLKEILFPGNKLLVQKADNPNRKTGWDLISGHVEGHWVLVNSALHRYIAEWVLSLDGPRPFGKLTKIQPEVKVGHSRLDFVAGRDGKTFGLEVKGCTLAVNGTALFPDAPTERGRRHVVTLMDMIDARAASGLMIVIFRPDAEEFAPKADTDPDFAQVFYEAIEKGVEVHPLVFSYDKDTAWVEYQKEIPVRPKDQ